MATKTFKIGEYCKGGIITVETNKKKNTITIIGKDWDYSKGKNFNFDTAQEFTRQTFIPDGYGVRSEMEMFLNDLTTSYYTDQILEWIESDKDNKFPVKLF